MFICSAELHTFSVLLSSFQKDGVGVSTGTVGLEFYEFVSIPELGDILGHASLAYGAGYGCSIFAGNESLYSQSRALAFIGVLDRY